MTAEEILIEAKHEEIIANAKFEAFEKVMQQTKRLMESCQRKGKEYQAEVERHKQPQSSDNRLYCQAIHNYAASNAYLEIFNVVANAYNNCKDEYIKYLQETNAKLDELKEEKELSLKNES